MRSFRHVRAGLGVLLAVLATQAMGASRITYSLDLGGSNNAQQWKSGTRVPYVRGNKPDGTEFYNGYLLNYAVILEASGVHSQPGHASDNKEIFGAANVVFNLELLDANDQPVTDAIFKSTINDGQGSDPLAASAFAVGFTFNPTVAGRLIDATTLGGPRLEPIFTYPTAPPSSGKLIGMGAGFKEWIRTGAGITMPGLGMMTVPPPPSNPGGARRNGLGIVPIAEGQIDISNLAPGTYKLRVSAGAGNNVLRGDLDMVAATNRPAFAVAANETAAPVTRTFVVSDQLPCEGVVGRHLFYNNSYWDGNNPAITEADLAAIATDKEALLPGQTSGFKNVTSYEKGINGIIVEACHFDRVPTLDEDIFFIYGNSNDPGGWTDFAPAPQAMQVLPGAGPNDPDRLVITWADNAIPNNKWLMVILAAGDGSLGIPVDDFFIFGGAIGEASGDLLVSPTDEIAARNNMVLPPARTVITNLYDFNRDSRVTATDQVIARNNRTIPINSRLVVFNWAW